jgi:hypothetical protein
MGKNTNSKSKTPSDRIAELEAEREALYEAFERSPSMGAKTEIHRKMAAINTRIAAIKTTSKGVPVVEGFVINDRPRNCFRGGCKGF